MNNPNNTAEAVPSLDVVERAAPRLSYMVLEAKQKLLDAPRRNVGGLLDAALDEVMTDLDGIERAAIAALRTPEPKGDAEAMYAEDRDLNVELLEAASVLRVTGDLDLADAVDEAAAFIRSLQQRNAVLMDALKAARAIVIEDAKACRAFRDDSEGPSGPENVLVKIDAALASVKGEVE